MTLSFSLHWQHRSSFFSQWTAVLGAPWRFSALAQTDLGREGGEGGRKKERGRKSVRVCGKDNEFAYQSAKCVLTCGITSQLCQKSRSPGNTASGEVVAACQGAYSTRSPRHRGGGGGGGGITS